MNLTLLCRSKLHNSVRLEYNKIEWKCFSFLPQNFFKSCIFKVNTLCCHFTWTQGIGSAFAIWYIKAVRSTQLTNIQRWSWKILGCARPALRTVIDRCNINCKDIQYSCTKGNQLTHILGIDYIQKSWFISSKV